VTLAERALDVLRRNDTGLFIKPGPRVYPFQWNWDSALVALGLARVDPGRGRAEVRSLLRGQWVDGMVPHMVFHTPAPEYRPGPELWDSASCPGAPEVPTSGITQPPVLATAVRALHEAAPEPGFLEEVLPRLDAWLESGWGKTLIGLRTGIPDLDDRTAGLRGLTVLGAQPNSGKTALAVQVAAGVAAHHEANDAAVVFVSLDMGRDEIVARILSHLAGLDWATLRQGSPEFRGQPEGPYLNAEDHARQ